MREEKITQRLKFTGIPLEDEFAVPVNGVMKKLPYLISRKEIDVTGSDNGRVRLKKLRWTVALFSTGRDEKAELKILKALAGVGKVSVTRFPDGTPYQTNFEFTSIEPL